MAPRGTPPAIIARLNADIAAVLQGGDLREKLASQGFVPEPSTQQHFARHIRAELERFRALVQAAGIPVE
jgi:tripartite-type tricarboxylate transporter receptor subunit TctC